MNGGPQVRRYKAMLLKNIYYKLFVRHLPFTTEEHVVQRASYSDMFASRLPFLDAMLGLTFCGTAWSFYKDFSWWRRWCARRSELMVGLLNGNYLFDGYMYRGTLYITRVRDAGTDAELYSKE